MVEEGPEAGARARVLVTHFDGALDAGQVGHMAVSQVLRSLEVARVATFDTDALVDYRSHRPFMTVKNWVTTDLLMPQIALDLVRDDLGTPFLLLHGPEPDFRWEAFADAVWELADASGVEVTVSLHGVPAGSPHTRPTPVHVQATDRALLPEQPQMMSAIQFPAPMSSFLQARLARRGIDGVSLLAAVPFYLTEHSHPAGASAVLTRLSEFADLSLPVGDLERGAAEGLKIISDLIAENPDVGRTVAALEQHYDQVTSVEGALSLDPLGGGRSAGSQAPAGPEATKDIGEVIEAYLANMTKRAQQSDSAGRSPLVDASREGADDSHGAGAGTADSIEEVLRRVAERRSNPNGPRSSGGRHRADRGDDSE
ncbi:PAC2 family protein [Schaalia sp. 19OD2882]|uniref:PAC2 family protein n=1 Tax=Schaalia sp. 19OD2882 TaxID=2794089 RepID=UPI001C1EBABD|nr:PAC2 family protein [Schaalia sp. 19OD2882]QWW20701.1 PAC2 family protein [Schaalia sp. 19OD2882]